PDNLLTLTMSASSLQRLVMMNTWFDCSEVVLYRPSLFDTNPLDHMLGLPTLDSTTSRL
ncbi:hypothetical protein TorRG33x02_032420, partial [Trema orientale]